jgi:ABC-type nickel/cobalt efflux system permease component RcnA
MMALMFIGIASILNPQAAGLTLFSILVISFILGLLHGATPDEHTWPITFSYAIGSYSTKKGMRAGFVFSAGFTAQRALLTTLGFLGLAAIYKRYDLNGPVYVLVGIAMFVAGIYILNKRKYIHLPFDALLSSRKHHTHHTGEASRLSMDEGELKEVNMKMAAAHGLIAGFGFGAYATIITFILAPNVPGLIYAPLPGLFFGLGTMLMQIIFGAVFANLAKLKKMSEKQISYIGRKTAGRTLYYGGAAFAVIGILVVAFPYIDKIAVSTGNPIPNLDSIGVSTILVMFVVGIIGIGSLIKGIREISKLQGDTAGKNGGH